jgi:hypothetical protein
MVVVVLVPVPVVVVVVVFGPDVGVVGVVVVRQVGVGVPPGPRLVVIE